MNNTASTHHINNNSGSGVGEELIDINNINEGIVYVEGGVGYKRSPKQSDEKLSSMKQRK